MPSDIPAGSLSRSVVVLKELASAGERGMALTHLSRSCGLPHSSAHRVLRQLCDAGLARQTEPEGHYALGALAFELGIAAARQFDIRGLSRPALTGLADETGDSAYLFIRSGSEAVCLDVAFGPSPIRVVTLRVGSRRPLGLGAGGLALLGALDEDESDAVLVDVADQLQIDHGIDPAVLTRMLRATRSRGWAQVDGDLTPGASAVGAVFRNSFGNPVGAVSIAAPTSRIPRVRIAEITRALDRAINRIEVSLFASRPGPDRPLG